MITGTKTELYNTGLAAMRNAKDADDFYKSADMFKQIAGFKDSNELSKQCHDKATETVNERSYQEALNVKTLAESCASANMFREAESVSLQVLAVPSARKLAYSPWQFSKNEFRAKPLDTVHGHT